MYHHKQQAARLAAALKEQGLKLRHSYVLEVVAALHGLPNWDNLMGMPGAAPLSGEAAVQAVDRRLRFYNVALEPVILKAATLETLGPDTKRRSMFPAPPRWLDPEPELSAAPLAPLIGAATKHTLAPWPLLPDMSSDETGLYPVTPAILRARQLNWERNAPLRADGVPVPGWQDEDGGMLRRWADVLDKALPGTSHYSDRMGLGNDPDTFMNYTLARVMLRRGVEAAPPAAPRGDLGDARLLVVFGKPGGVDRCTKMLALASACAELGPVHLLPDPSLTGDAAQQLKGRCRLVTNETALLGGVQTLVMHGYHKEELALIRAAQQQGVRVVIATWGMSTETVAEWLDDEGIDTSSSRFFEQQQEVVTI